MSSDLHDLFRSDLERIPLPPSAEWARARVRRRSRTWTASIAVALVVLIVVGSLSAGQAMRAVRDWVETQRVATGLVPGNDYVYLSDGDAANQYVQIAAMPSGQSVGRLAGQTYVGTNVEGSLMSVSGDFAYLPVSRSAGLPADELNTYLQQIDLRRGIPLGRIGIGFVNPPRVALIQPLITPRFAAATATSADGKSVWLVRDTGERGLVASIDRFDAQTLSARPIARTEIAGSGTEAIRSTVVALDGGGAAVVRVHYPANFQSAAYGADWIFLDEQLRVLATYRYDDQSGRLPALGMCSDVRTDPGTGGWIVLCSDPFGFADGAVVFFARDGSISGQIPLQRELGYALGMTVAGDTTVSVLTMRPLVARIDGRTHRLIDTRPVTESRSLLDHLLPPVAAAKGPSGRSVVFSSDGRYAYVIAGPEQWWGSLAKIDLSTAKVVARTSAVRYLGGLGMSEDGKRLYALAIDYDSGARTLALFDPETLQLASQSEALPNEPYAIVAIRTRLP